MRRLLQLLAFSTTASIGAQAPSHTLMPVPASVVLNSSKLNLDSSFTVAIIGYRDGRLERAVNRAVGRLEARLGTALPHQYSDDSSATLVVRVATGGFAIPDLREDESYNLDIGSGGAQLVANTVVGAIRGLETLLQLHTINDGKDVFQGAHIVDAPRFPWRGLLVDAARHWQPPAVIKRTLDGMAAAKLNVLHWHLTEDQGFRVESKKFPTLQLKGSDGNYYTQTEIREIVAYATDRGIRVVPEFDMPGHTTAWFVGHPELASAPGPYSIERKWGVHAPTMDPTRAGTYEFLSEFIGEMVQLFPDKYWHIGGDEVRADQWNNSPRIQAWMRDNGVASIHDLQTHFNQQVFTILKRYDRQPVGWDEILQPELPKAAVIQSWRGMDGLVNATSQGRQAILSAPYYLDHMKTAAEMYLVDPLPAGLSTAQASLVLGGEACMWAEYVTMETIDSRIWPRMLAVAERFWSPAQVKDVPDMYRRLAINSRRLSEVGPTHFDHAKSMLARIFPTDDILTVQRFLNYARPRGFGGRGTNQLSPLTRLVDAADPDPIAGPIMMSLARQSASTVRRSRLDQHFQEMMSFETLFKEMLPRAPMAQDAMPLAMSLYQLGKLGHEAVEYQTSGAKPPPSWLDSAQQVLSTTVGKTFGLLRPVGGEAVQLLVKQLSER